MLSRLRFNTARQVVEAFPSAGNAISLAPSDEEPLAFVRKLSGSPRPLEAIAFCAYLLPRREAVWWACQCVRAIEGHAIEDDAALIAAEAWVREPEEARRRAALAIGAASERRAATTLLARAAGWSGGNMALEGPRPIAAPPHLTAKAVYAAIGLAIANAEISCQSEIVMACVDAGIRFAAGGDARPQLAQTPVAPSAKRW